MGKDGKGFAELIEEAQRLPSTSTTPAEITSPFPLPVPNDHRVVDDVVGGKKVSGAVEYDYDAHVEVLCLNQKEEREEYVGILNQILKGEGILRYEDRSMTKEGDSMVTICWLTPKPRPSKRKLSSVPDDADEG